ncbi:hypothetical protein ACNPDE_002844 [Vibrio fluvialis]
MNVQIHPSYFQMIASSEPFSQMIDVVAASGSKTHYVYVLLALARSTKLSTACVNTAFKAEINRRIKTSSIQSSKAGGVA